jgi:hypothetical protein
VNLDWDQTPSDFDPVDICVDMHANPPSDIEITLCLGGGVAVGHFRNDASRHGDQSLGLSTSWVPIGFPGGFTPAMFYLGLCLCPDLPWRRLGEGQGKVDAEKFGGASGAEGQNTLCLL